MIHVDTSYLHPPGPAHSDVPARAPAHTGTQASLTAAFEAYLHLIETRLGRSFCDLLDFLRADPPPICFGNPQCIGEWNSFLNLAAAGCKKGCPCETNVLI